MSNMSLFTGSCWDGDVEYVRYELLNGQDPNERDEDDGYTGLMHAVENKKKEILELLLEQPEIDINCVNENGDTALHVACFTSNLWALEKLGSDPRINILNKRNNDGITPLIVAARMGNVSCVRELLKIPCINLYNTAIRTLEDMACEACEEIDLNDRKAKILSLIGHASIKKSNLFVTYCMDGNVKEAKQALIDGQDPNGVTYCMNGKVKEAKRALIDGQDPDTKAEHKYYGYTPLATAVIKKQNNIVELLLEQPDIDLDWVDENGDTALHAACYFGNNPWAVGKLGSHPRIKTLNSRNKYQITPIMHAVRMGNVECVRELVKLKGVQRYKSLEDITCELVKSNKNDKNDRKNNILCLLQDARRNKCEYCEYESDKRSNLEKHIETHKKVKNIGKFKCDKCDFSDNQKKRLTQHTKRKHPLVDNE